MSESTGPVWVNQDTVMYGVCPRWTLAIEGLGTIRIEQHGESCRKAMETPEGWWLYYPGATQPRANFKLKARTADEAKKEALEFIANDLATKRSSVLSLLDNLKASVKGVQGGTIPNCT